MAPPDEWPGRSPSWTVEEIRALAQGRLEGLGPGEMVSRLPNRTENAIRSAMGVHGLRAPGWRERAARLAAASTEGR